jgi:hypothetical protein
MPKSTENLSSAQAQALGIARQNLRPSRDIAEDAQQALAKPVVLPLDWHRDGTLLYCLAPDANGNMVNDLEIKVTNSHGGSQDLDRVALVAHLHECLGRAD